MPRDAKPKASGPARRFRATLERLDNGLGWVGVRIPFDAARLWGRRGQVRVKGTINGFEFANTLFPTGDGGHVLLVNRKMQKGGRTEAGLAASFDVQPDTTERRIEVPAELTLAIDQDRGLRKYIDSMNPSTRREIAKWVAQPKSAEARARRAEQIAERLMTTMLAERGELPPLLATALARNPQAKRGWDLMPPSKKRFHLIGLTGYKSPESRQKRLAKTVDEAMHYAETADRRGGSRR
jgi:uncharacterized protein YdeI (YjbR/CyaY-like superfamily)